MCAYVNPRRSIPVALRPECVDWTSGSSLAVCPTYKRRGPWSQSDWQADRPPPPQGALAVLQTLAAPQGAGSQHTVTWSFFVVGRTSS